MTQEEIKMVLIEHGNWIANSNTGAKANLSGADLSWANLSRANLSGADLSRAKGVYCFGPMPTSGRLCVAVWAENKWLVKAGCFWGDLDQLEEKVKDDHNCPIYLANIQLLRNWTYE